MTVSSAISRHDYIGNGILDTYPFTFEIYVKTDLKVYVSGVLKTVDVHYAIPVGGINNPAGGNVIFTAGNIPASNAPIAVILDLPLTQLVNYIEGDKFPAETHEKALDRLVKIAQKGNEAIGRAIKFDTSSILKNISFPEPGAGGYIRWNALGTGLEAVSSAGVVLTESPSSPWIDARYYTTLEAANTAAYDAGKTLLIASNWTLTANTALTASVMRIPGGSFTKASTYTLSFSGKFVNPDNGYCFIGFSAGDVTFGAGAVEEVYSGWWTTNTTPGTTNMTVAINSAIATGKNIKGLDTTYGTTGGHVMNIRQGQKLIGVGREEGTIIKRLSGTSTILQLTGKNFQEVAGFTIDGNSLGGIGLDIRGTAQNIHDLLFKNTGGTSYALNVQGVNNVRVGHVYFYNGNYGNLKTDNALYSSFYDIQGGVPSTGYGILVQNDSNGLDFVNVYMEGKILIDGSAAGNTTIHFNGLYSETELNSGSWFTSNATGNIDIGINGGRLNHTGTSTDPIFNITAFGFYVKEFFLRRTGVSAGTIFNLSGSSTNIMIENFIDHNDTAHNFFVDSASSALITLKNCWVHSSGAAGTNVWSGSFITVENSNMKQSFTATANRIHMINVAGQINITNLPSNVHATFINCDNMINSAAEAFDADSNGTWRKTTTGDLTQVINGVIVINEFDDTIKIGKEGVWVAI